MVVLPGVEFDEFIVYNSESFSCIELSQGVAGEFKSTDCSEATGNLHLLVAAGPFSTSDNLSLEPLEDLIKVIKKTRPDACILVSIIFL